MATPRSKTSNRKAVSFTPAEASAFVAQAAKAKLGKSALLRSWIEDFLEHGSDIHNEERTVLVEARVPAEILNAAEEKAREEYGVALNDIIRHRLSQAG